MNIKEQFMGRTAGPLIQFIKYGISGGLATVVHIFLFYIFAGFVFPAFTESDLAVKYLGLPAADIAESLRARNATIDNIIVFFFSNMVAYILNILWVFESGRHNRFVEILLFYAVSGVSAIVSNPIMYFIIRRYGITTTIAFGVCIVVSVLVNYAMRKFVIFKN